MLGLFRNAERYFIRRKFELPSLQTISAKLYSTDDETLTHEELCGVHTHWESLQKKRPKIGLDFFTVIFERFPHFVPLFKKFGKDTAEVLNNPNFQHKHVDGIVMESFGTAVIKLHHPCELKFYINAVGRQHLGMCLKPSDFDCAGDIMLQAIRKNSCDMSCEAQMGWKKAIVMIMAGFKEGMVEK